MLRVLRNRTYRHLFIAQVVALVGTGLATVALSLLAYDLAGADASAVLGTALAIKMVAYVGIAPLVAAFATRIPRRTLLAGSDLIRTGVALALPFVTQVWQIYVLIFLLQAASAAFTPTFQATIPELLKDERDYTQALTLSRLAYDLESLFSPVLAAGLLSLITYNWLFMGTVFGFLASAAFVVFVVLPKPQPVERTGGPFAAATFGARLFGKAPQLRALLALNLAVAAGGAMVIVNTVVLARDYLQRGAGDTSLALGAFGAGSMAVALLLPRVLTRVGDRTVMLSGAYTLVGGLLTVTATLAAGVFSWPVMLAAWAVLGAATAAVLTPTGRLIRRSVAPADLPAAFAAQFSLSHAAWLLTYPLAGWLASESGMTAAAATLTVIGLTAAVATRILWPARVSPATPRRPRHAPGPRSLRHLHHAHARRRETV
ncbi:MFS transporter [Sinosporangium siamense]|uniref:MFS transporter n=1 Tax=Sinosporangium siamense TaxID=1367973 RepID=A0A919RPA0_9ACTN|nr:MFS transporter [Sinosporangium siamense]GII96777.1 MFS transporter [Sinosporangium siamense]